MDSSVQLQSLLNGSYPTSPFTILEPQNMLHGVPELPDQMFHILVQARLTEKQFIFGFNRKTSVFVLYFVVFDFLKLRSTLFDSFKL